jgi:hypothetical protein
MKFFKIKINKTVSCGILYVTLNKHEVKVNVTCSTRAMSLKC